MNSMGEKIFLCKLKELKVVFLLILIYSAAYFLLLLDTNGIYWDDWTLFRHSHKAISIQFHQMGFPQLGSLFSWLFSYKYGVFIARIFTFSLFLASGLLFYFILKRIKEINALERFFLTAFFLVFPVNSARIATIMLTYSICYLLFFLAFYITTKYSENKNIFLRILALILFFLSFQINSLLVFYALVIAFIFYKEKTLFKYLDFLLLPIIFFAIKNIFFKPYGAYENYNQIKLNNNILEIILDTLSNSSNTLFRDISRSLEITNFQALIILFVSFFLLLLLSRIFSFYDKQTLSNKQCLLFIAIGACALFLSIFPYIVVNKYPSFLNEYNNLGWNDRHLLLTPLGASFILVYAIRYLQNYFKINSRVSNLILCFLVFSFAFRDFKDLLVHYRDRIKSEAIIQYVAENSQKIEKYKIVFLSDEFYPSPNTFKYNLYESNGWFKEVYKKENRLVCQIASEPVINKMANKNLFRSFKLCLQRTCDMKELAYSPKGNLYLSSFCDPYYTWMNLNDFYVPSLNELSNQEVLLMRVLPGRINLLESDEMRRIIENKIFNKKRYKEKLKNIIEVQIVTKKLEELNPEEFLTL